MAAGYSRSSGIGSKADARLRRAAAAVSQRTAFAGAPYQVDGGVIVKANPANTVDGRFERDGIFVQYAASGADVFGVGIDSGVRLGVLWSDPVTNDPVLRVYWDSGESQYILNLYNTIVAQFTATTIICGSLFADNGDFDFVRINTSSGPALGIPGVGECVAYMQTSGGVDYLRVKFNSGAVREIANSSHNLVQFDGIGVNGGIPSAGEIAFGAAGVIYSGGGGLFGDLTLACYGVTGDIILNPVGQVTINAAIQADGYKSEDGTAGIDDSAAGVPTALTASGGLVTSVSKTTPVADGTYAIDGSAAGTVSSITVTNGIITAIATR